MQYLYLYEPQKPHRNADTQNCSAEFIQICSPHNLDLQGPVPLDSQVAVFHIFFLLIHLRKFALKFRDEVVTGRKVEVVVMRVSFLSPNLAATLEETR
jgi:hypothetical protein